MAMSRVIHGVLVAVTMLAAAQQAVTQEVRKTADQQRTEETGHPENADTSQLIELNFPANVELKVLIDYISKRLGLNILYDEQVAGKRITIQSPTRVPASSLVGILESALRMKGLLLIEGEQAGWKKIVAIQQLTAVSTPRTDAEQDGVPHEAQTRVFVLKHAQPAQVEPVLKPFLSQPGGNTIVVANQRLLIVTDFASNMPRLDRLIALMDRPPSEVTMRFVPVRHLSANALAPRVSQLVAAQARVRDAGAGGSAVPDVDISADERTNQIIVIGPPERVEVVVEVAGSLDVPLGLETRVYQFSTVSPERIDRLTRELVDPETAKHLYRATVDKEAGILIATTTPSIHQQVDSLRESLDVVVPVEQSPIRIYKLTNANAPDVLETIRAIEGQQGFESVSLGENNEADTVVQASNEIGVQRVPPPFEAETEPARSMPLPLQGLGPRSVRSERATVTSDPNTNSIIVIADPATQRVYEQLIQMLDQRRPQVLIEATIVTIDTTDDFSLGVEFAREGSVTIGGEQISTLFFSQFGLSTLNPNTNRLEIEPGLGFNGVLLSTDIADVVIRALKSNGRSTVMSAPKLLVNDNATGSIDSINEAPFASINASNTVSTTSFGGFISAGTQISVTPRIAEGDHLRLEFEVALNSFTGDAAEGLPPPRQTNSIQSEVTIPDGHTIVVGGLNRIDASFAKQAIPFLGAIPGVEYLFSSRTQGRRNATLFVFIRPVILRDDRFRDLKYLSARDRVRAELPDPGIPGAPGAPTSRPMLVR